MNSREQNDESGLEQLHTGRTVVVAGGTGNVGQVLVRSLLQAGATVVVPSRTERKLSDLRAGLDPEATERLVTIQGDVGDEERADGLVERIVERAGPIHAAVATLGRFVAVPSLFEASVADLEQVLDGYLIGHFVAARTLIPAIEKGGSYTLINGPLAFRPMQPSAGLVSAVTAAQAMLARVLIEEVEDVRVNELVLHTPFGWGEEAEKRAPVRQDQVGRYVSHLASRRAKDIRGETIHLDSQEVLQELVPAG